MVGADGWPFASVDQFPGAEVDPLYNSEHIKDLYFRADPDYNARYVTVPSDIHYRS
jgi:putative glutathione S-transferase